MKKLREKGRKTLLLRFFSSAQTRSTCGCTCPSPFRNASPPPPPQNPKPPLPSKTCTHIYTSRNPSDNVCSKRKTGRTCTSPWSRAVVRRFVDGRTTAAIHRQASPIHRRKLITRKLFRFCPGLFMSDPLERYKRLNLPRKQR